MQFEQLHGAWQLVAENRIRAAQNEGEFRDLPGFGRPLEEFMDIEDPNGWIRRTVRDTVRGAASVPQITSRPNVQKEN